ncbi:MAG: glycosyltransferase [Thermodesulforhabdaceae bacterium]
MKLSENPTTSFDEFINLSRISDITDRYVILQTIREAISQHVFLLSGILLDIGCGMMPYKDFILKNNPNIKEYIGLEFEEGKYKASKGANLVWDGDTIPLADSSVDCVTAVEIIERCKNPLRILKEIRRVLTPGGVFLFTTSFLWSYHGIPNDYYKYTPFSIKKLLLEAKFEDFQIKPLGGWHAAFAQMMGLWIKRAPLSEETRQQFFKELYPLYLKLLEEARKEHVKPESEHALTPGWIAVAYASYNEKGIDRVTIPPILNTPIKICFFSDVHHDYFQMLTEDYFFYLDPDIKVIRGGTLPMFDQDKKCVLNPSFFDAIKGLPPDKVLSIYTKFLADYLRREQFDVVFAEFGVVGANVYKACEEASIPYVVHFHGSDIYNYDIIKQYEKSYLEIFKGASYLVTASKSVREKLVSLGAPSEKIILNPYGTLVKTHEMANPETAPPIFLAIGKFVEENDLHTTIKAFQKVISAVPEARLIIVGDGPFLENCKKLAGDLGIGDNVIFTGACNRKSVAKFMMNSRALVQCSMSNSDISSEELFMTILEAGSKGLPIIGARHTDITDVVVDGEHGFLVDKDNWQELAEAMILLAGNPRLARIMGNKFKRRVRANHSVGRYVIALKKTLMKAAGKDKIIAVYSSEFMSQSQKQLGEKTTFPVTSKTGKYRILERQLFELTLKKDFKTIVNVAKGEQYRTPLVDYFLGNAYLQLEFPEEALSCWERVIRHGDLSFQFVRRRFEQLKNYPDMVIGKNLLYGDEPKVHILLLTMNRKPLLEKTFECLGKTDYRNYKVFLLDNCSNDGTKEILPGLRNFLPKWIDFTFESLPTNIGCPGGHNWMLTYWDHSEADFIVFIEDDVLDFKPSWLRLFVNTFTLSNNIKMVGSKTLQMNGAIQDAFAIVRGVRNSATVEIFTHRDEPDFGQYDLITNIPDYVIECFTMFRKDIFDKVGLFDISLSPSQLDDVDFGIRARKAGYDIVYNGNISVVHAQLTHEERKKSRAAIASLFGNSLKLANKFSKADFDELIVKRIAREKAFWESDVDPIAYITGK